MRREEDLREDFFLDVFDVFDDFRALLALRMDPAIFLSFLFCFSFKNVLMKTVAKGVIQMVSKNAVTKKSNR